MANFPINTGQASVDQALRMVEISDPVHADVYNAMFEKLINNDAFLERLANKMIQQAMIAHVLDSSNNAMVLGADQAPEITKIIDKERERIDQLNNNLMKSNIGAITISTNNTTNGTITIKCPGGKQGMALVMVSDFHTPGKTNISLWAIGYTRTEKGNASKIDGNDTRNIIAVSEISSTNEITLTFDTTNVMVRSIAFDY